MKSEYTVSYMAHKIALFKIDEDEVSYKDSFFDLCKKELSKVEDCHPDNIWIRFIEPAGVRESS